MYSRELLAGIMSSPQLFHVHGSLQYGQEQVEAPRLQRMGWLPGIREYIPGVKRLKAPHTPLWNVPNWVVKYCTYQQAFTPMRRTAFCFVGDEECFRVQHPKISQIIVGSTRACAHLIFKLQLSSIPNVPSMAEGRERWIYT